ncbi:MAG: hypothetical protein Q8R37_03915 [Nanoarchaeota archaeon]|nr:hypothetical protein [Nanoarchaeota archaeon]
MKDYVIANQASSGENYIIVGHRIDPDGIISHALLRRAFSNNPCHHYFVDYDDFFPVMQDINNRLKDLKKPHLIVADISLNLVFQDEYLFQGLGEKTESFTWIDHHLNTFQNEDFLVRSYARVVYEPHLCTAELVQRRYAYSHNLDSDYNRMLARVAHAHDFERRQMLEWTLGDVLQNIIKSNNNDIFGLSKLVQDLGAGNVWDEEGALAPHYQRIVQDCQKKKREAYVRLEENVDIVHCAGKKVLFAYADPILYMKDAPEHLKRINDVDYVVVAFEGISNVIVFGKGNVGKSVIEFCQSMGGGGRGHAGGFTIGHAVTEKDYSQDKTDITGKLEQFLESYNPKTN